MEAYSFIVNFLLLLQEADSYKAEIHSNRSEIHKMDKRDSVHYAYLVICPNCQSTGLMRVSEPFQHTGPEISVLSSSARKVNSYI